MKTLALLFFGMSFQCWAELSTANRVFLSTLESNTDARVTEIWLETDADDAAQAVVKFVRGGGGEVSFPVEGLGSGIVLVREMGRDIFTLRSERFTPEEGGPVRMEYIHNGLTGSNRQVELELTKEDGRWHFSHEGQAFRKMLAVSNRVLGKIVGVKEIQFSPVHDKN